ncbi:MAG: hypothetical protein GXO02_04350 [Epsilonproteobacteria bacterium]|nr:hypothetical protein [Campylobacterota bacterium]
MRKEEIDTFLNLVFKDTKLFINLNGADKLFDRNFMLVYDALQDDLYLLSEVIEERLANKALKVLDRETKFVLKNRRF